AVAAIFGTTAVALAAENQIDDIQTVHACQVLRISVAGEVVVWVVEDGDTLTELARRFDISVAGEVVVWVVEDGDTLTELARRFDIGVASLVAINGLADGDALSVGQRLTILPGR
ncbi:MAG: LysM domain-containing protein, partial [Chloroflexi bacterium]|nr:LysM domain-containing protein [Chloroflexota bacterium]